MNYVLYVYCRRNGMSCDSGRHTSQPFENDQAALAGMREVAERDLGHHYDSIGCLVKEASTTTREDDERYVGQFSVTRPQSRSPYGF